MKEKKWAALIIFYNSKNELLLQERWDYSKFWEEWAFFWWWIEDWETANEAFLREAKEELDLDMNNFDFNYIWEFIFEFPSVIIHRNFFLVKTDLKEKDFTVLEWSWAKYFSFEETKQQKFINPVGEMLDIIKKAILWKQ